MSDKETEEAEVIRGYLTDRVMPAAGEVFDAFLIVGIDTGGKRRLFCHVKDGENGSRLAMEISPLLASAIFFVEEPSNTSQQKGKQ
jgi:hypothetical protein